MKKLNKDLFKRKITLTLPLILFYHHQDLPICIKHLLQKVKPTSFIVNLILHSKVITYWIRTFSHLLTKDQPIT